MHCVLGGVLGGVQEVLLITSSGGRKGGFYTTCMEKGNTKYTKYK